MAESVRTVSPDPDLLPAQARRAGRGRLKIFLGAAPGVGKTHAMLETARERHLEGVDVVIGLIDSHERREVEQLAEGLERLAPRIAEYRGRAHAEFDLDAVLARHPALVLVDDLAHANITGSRHPKRHQDVEELLAAGIDVLTTLNIQHLESLNDIVARITGVRVRDTVPDSAFAAADDIELVDLAPSDLLKRLAEGKVYIPEAARQTVHEVFSPGHLAALRELALRHAADRVDQQMVEAMRAQSIAGGATAGPWPTRDRLIVCLGDDVPANRLVRAAKRLAERRNAPWAAVHVATSRHLALPAAEKDRIDQAMRLAEQLGGEAITLAGEDVATELLAYAIDRNATTLVLGRPRTKESWRWLRGKTVTERLMARAGAFDLVLVGGEDEPARLTLPPAPVHRSLNPLNYFYALLIVAGTIPIGIAIDRWITLADPEVALLIAVLAVAIRLGRGPSILASLVSFVAYNYFFTQPQWSFSIANTQVLTALIFFLVSAVVVSDLASRARQQIETTRFNARRTGNLYDFSRRIAGAAGRDDVLWAVVHHVAATMRGHSLVLLPQNEKGGEKGGEKGQDGLVIAAGYPPEDRIAARDEAAALWTWRNGAPAGRGSTTMPGADWLFVPLATGRGAVGVLGVQVEGKERLTSDDSRLLETLADQAAVAIERTMLVADVEAARLAAETERLRGALLSSLSHDLRTPLVSILGAATSLLNFGDGLNKTNRRELAETIRVEAERLNRFVQNLLDMTRLGSGAMKPRVDWTDLADPISRAVDRARRVKGGRQVRLAIDPAMPLLQMDPVLMEQVFFNLLDNAAKFSPPDEQVTIWARPADGHALIEVCDTGPGIPEADRTRVFDMFYRVEATDKQTAGTGLGLAICQGIVAAHGGSIRAEPGAGGAGTCIVIQLPMDTVPTVPEAETVEA